jgi:hypothetical protein
MRHDCRKVNTGRLGRSSTGKKGEIPGGFRWRWRFILLSKRIEAPPLSCLATTRLLKGKAHEISSKSRTQIQYEGFKVSIPALRSTRDWQDNDTPVEFQSSAYLSV